VISRTGVHAIRALAFLAGLGPGEYAGAGPLARRIDAPQNYLGKLLQTLARSGIVESRKGAGGGFRLAGQADSVTLYQVLDVVEDIGRWNGCFLGRPVCSDDAPCSLHDRWAGIKGVYLKFLSETTVAHVAAREAADSERRIR